MKTNPDIMGEIGTKYRHSKVLIGFAAETDNVIGAARDKLQRKHLDAIIANQVGTDSGFGEGQYKAAIIGSDDDAVDLHIMTKDQLASQVADLLSVLKPKQGIQADV